MVHASVFSAYNSLFNLFQTRVLFFITGATLLFVNSLRDVFPELFSLEKLYEMLTSEEHGNATYIMCLP